MGQYFKIHGLLLNFKSKFFSNSPYPAKNANETFGREQLIQKFLLFFFGYFLFSATMPPALADHIPDYILVEIEREVNEPICRVGNLTDGTNYNCTIVDPYWASCWNDFLHEDLTYQQAVDLLGQIKVSNSYYDSIYVPEPNPYISADNMELLLDMDLICWF